MRGREGEGEREREREGEDQSELHVTESRWSNHNQSIYIPLLIK